MTDFTCVYNLFFHFVIVPSLSNKLQFHPLIVISFIFVVVTFESRKTFLSMSHFVPCSPSTILTVQAPRVAWLPFLTPTIIKISSSQSNQFPTIQSICSLYFSSFWPTLHPYSLPLLKGSVLIDQREMGIIFPVIEDSPNFHLFPRPKTTSSPTVSIVWSLIPRSLNHRIPISHFDFIQICYTSRYLQNIHTYRIVHFDAPSDTCSWYCKKLCHH